jgi:hypothetical protein
LKIEIEIDEAEVKKAVIERIAQDMYWRVNNDLKDKIWNSIKWSEMTSHVQEAVLKMAARKLFDKAQQ